MHAYPIIYLSFSLRQEADTFGMNQSWRKNDTIVEEIWSFYLALTNGQWQNKLHLTRLLRLVNEGPRGDN